MQDVLVPQARTTSIGIRLPFALHASRRADMVTPLKREFASEEAHIVQQGD